MDNDLKITLDNLKIVVEKLPILANTTHPNIKTEFSMESFGCMIDKQSISECASNGCLLGNIIYVFPIIHTDFGANDDTLTYTFNYTIYGKRLFPWVYKNLTTNIAWDFIFGSSWIHYDNSFEGAIERVNLFIKSEGNLGSWRYNNFSEGWWLKDKTV